MRKKIKLKDIDTTINFNEYVSNIVDIVGKEKNIILKLKDDSGVIPAILIGNRNSNFKKIIQNLKINDTYLIKGNTNILNRPNDEELSFIFKKINSIINIGDIYLIVNAIKKIRE